MTKNKTDIFLGRGGKIFGPIEPAQFEQLKQSGELNTYTYWWDPKAASWQAVEQPPPAPGSATAVVQTSLAGMPAVCHDFRMTMVSGRLENVTDQGCDLVSTDTRELPSFGTDSDLTLNLADAQSGQSLNVKAMLGQVWRQGQLWVYRLRWDKQPSFE